MRKYSSLIIGLLALMIVAALLFWQYNKKAIVRNVIQDAVSSKSGDLYFIKYDSSRIDEASGNASFYNIRLQSDSLQGQLLQLDSAERQMVYNVQIAEVTISGTNIPALIANQKVEAKSITIIKPVIHIIRAYSKESKDFKIDTLEIYEKLLGKFKSISTGKIMVKDASIYISEKTNSPLLSLVGVNAEVNNLIIDSTKNYDNLISYFIKDIDLKIKDAVFNDESSQSNFVLKGLHYNASQKFISLDNFEQKDLRNNRIAFFVNNTFILGLQTDSFILRNKLKADEFRSDGGLMSFTRKVNKDVKSDRIELNNDIFVKAILNKLTLKKTQVLVYNGAKPGEAPIILENVAFSANGVQSVSSGVTVRDIIAKSNWLLTGDGFSIPSKNNVYRISLGAFVLDKARRRLIVDNFSVSPQLSQKAFVKTLDAQKDLFDLTIRKISLDKINIERLVYEKTLIADVATLQPDLKVFNDRTVEANELSKVGNYPHQIIRKLDFPIFIKIIKVKNGYVSYTERSAASALRGSVFFSNTNGVIRNFTNINDFITQDRMLTIDLKTRFLGKADLKTEWNLPLDTKNGSFTISGAMNKFDAQVLNPMIEPLALASIKNGSIESLKFTINGNDLEAHGESVLLYNDLKVEALKKDSAELKKRGLLSFFANLLVKDDNPKNGETRVSEISIKRNKSRSFFNLIWQGIFDAAKRTALGKNDRK